MSWYKKAQQGLLFYPYDDAVDQDFRSPTGREIRYEENQPNANGMYQCQECKDMYPEDEVVFKDFGSKQMDYSLYVDPEVAQQALSTVAEHLAPLYTQYKTALDQKVAEQDPTQGRYHFIAGEFNRSWEVQIPMVGQILNMCPNLVGAFTAFSDSIHHSLFPIVEQVISGQTEVNGYWLDSISSFVENPNEPITQFVTALSRQTFPMTQKAIYCTDCGSDIADECDGCGEDIYPGEDMTELAGGEKICEECNESGNYSYCNYCNQTVHSDNINYLDEWGDDAACDSCKIGIDDKNDERFDSIRDPLLSVTTDEENENYVSAGNTLPMSSKQLSSLYSAVDTYISKFGNIEFTYPVNVQKFQKKISAGINQEGQTYLAALINSPSAQSASDILAIITQGINVQGDMEDKYGIDNYTDVPYEVEVIRSYSNQDKGFTFGLNIEKSFFEYGETMFPNILSIWEVMSNTPHHNKYLAYARCAYDDDTNQLMINNLQRDADFDNWKSAAFEPTPKDTECAKWIHKMTKGWDVFLIDIVSSTCKEMGLAGYITTFETQKMRWGRLPKHKSKATYDNVPASMGFHHEEGADQLQEGRGDYSAWRIASWYGRAMTKESKVSIIPLEELNLNSNP